MKKIKYIIGKPNRIAAVLCLLIFGGWGLWLTYIGYFDPPTDAIIKQISPIAGPATLIVTLLIVVPGMYNCKLRWKVDNENLYYTEYGGIINRIKIFYMPFKYCTYNLTLTLSQIDSIRLGWQDVPYFFYGLLSHPIVFYITMKDGTQVEMNSLVTKDSIKYCQAVDYLQSKNITIIDTYNLLSVIRNPKISVAQYIDDLVVKRYD